VCQTDLQQDISRASLSHQIERVLYFVQVTRASVWCEFLVRVSRASVMCLTQISSYIQMKSELIQYVVSRGVWPPCVGLAPIDI